MFAQKGMVEKKGRNGGLVAVAIDKDKGSQYALKWAIDNLLHRGQSVILIHVKLKQSSSLPPTSSLPSPRLTQFDAQEEFGSKQIDAKTRELFLPFRCFCTRKDIQCKDVMVEDVEVVKGLVEFVNQAAIEHLVIGSPSKSGFLRRFREKDIPNNASKMAPDYCTVYIIAKGKITSTRPASRSAPSFSPLHNQLVSQASSKAEVSETYLAPPTPSRPQRPQLEPIRNFNEATESMRSPLTRLRGYTGKSYGELSIPDSDISFVSSGRQSVDRLFPSFYDNTDAGRSPRLSTGSDRDYYGSDQFGRRSMDVSSPTAMSMFSQENDRMSWSSQDDVEAEMRRLKQELKQTMDMYSTACKEALTAKQKCSSNTTSPMGLSNRILTRDIDSQLGEREMVKKIEQSIQHEFRLRSMEKYKAKAKELQHWKLEEAQRLEEARMAEEAALAIAEREKAKSRAAIEAAEASQKIAELEAKKRIYAESKAMVEAEEKKKALDALAQTDVRYRKYSIEEIESATEHFDDSRKIGEGGYGPVYKCYLDHTSVAIKVLRPDAAQGRSQFQQEVEVLSCIRHPNMVLLLGACPEYGCLVYEYMANGSLDDRLFCRQNTPPLSWQLRFKIAAEIGTGLLFLHQTKPEPLVHRDLKPGNILLDRNFVSKISDVGLARLVPPSVSDTVTQYRMTSTAGTFCYIDPEYQQTGMLGLKSDIYSLGIMFLQLITAKPPMGLTHHVGRAIENGTLAQLLDPNVPDWPMEEVTGFAKMALKCAELRRKDRPDLGTVVLSELNRLRELSEDGMNLTMSEGSTGPSLKRSEVLVRPEVTSEHHIPQSEAKSGGSASF